MRKLSVLVVLAALLAAPTALAKERNVAMSAAPASAKAGKAWIATITVTIDGQPADGMGPMVRLVNAGGKTISIPSKGTELTGVYQARIVFPAKGLWRVIVVERYSGRAYLMKRIRVT